MLGYVPSALKHYLPSGLFDLLFTHKTNAARCQPWTCSLLGVWHERKLSLPPNFSGKVALDETLLINPQH